MKTLSNLIGFIRRQPRWRLALVAVVLAAGAWWLFKSAGAGGGKAATFTARRGPLDITVLEGGSLQALESQEIKCEVRVGYQGTKILKIVEEGYFVTEDDVKTNKVLVELDSSELEKQIAQQEISYQSALANLTDAQQNYEIQLNQNASDIKGAEQKLRFARMDFDKFLGGNVTEEIVKQLGLDKLIAEATTNNVAASLPAEKPDADKPAAMPKSLPPGMTNLPPELAKLLSSNAPASIAALKASLTNLSPEMLSALAKANMPGGARVVTPSDRPAGPRPAGSGGQTPGGGSSPTVVINRPAGPGGPVPGGGPSPASARPEPEEQPLPREASFQLPSTAAIDFEKYAKTEVLGDGEAKQKVRKFEDDLQVSQKELGQSTTTLEGTRRLFDKGFVTKNDLQRDEIAFDNSRLKVQTAETARDLFLKYDFPKSAEESLSKFLDSVRDMDRTRRLAISKLAQADARLRSAQGQYQVQLRQRKDLTEQRDKCFITAKKSGLVVYGGGGDQMYYYGGEERIREGASVRERQAIITIPDMSRMSVNVKIHETYIKKVKKGQKARITVDAFADKVLVGEVTKVGVLPDSQNRWINPDLKVYAVTIAIDGTQDWIKPGMSSKVEIMVNKLEDVVQIPVQAVTLNEGKQVCYVMRGFKPERREVEVGEFTDEFIEVKRGLKEGEVVLLRAPGGGESETGGSLKPTETKPTAPAEKSAPPPLKAGKATAGVVPNGLAGRSIC